MFEFKGSFIAEVGIPQAMVNKTVRELDLRNRKNITILLIKKPGQDMTTVWDPNTVLQEALPPAQRTEKVCHPQSSQCTLAPEAGSFVSGYGTADTALLCTGHAQSSFCGSSYLLPVSSAHPAAYRRAGRPGTGTPGYCYLYDRSYFRFIHLGM
jgi:hypothetical protein